MRVVIYDTHENVVEAFDNWNMPLPLVEDKVIDSKSNLWVVVERVFNAKDNTVSLFCVLQ
jgi:hypothetical protein